MNTDVFPNDADIETCLLADRAPLRRRLRQLRRRRREGKPFDRGLERLQSDIASSRAVRERRRAELPEPKFPAELPISERREEIMRLVAQHQVLVLCGETGSGKSTQLPKICLSLGRGVDGRIGHTQPRRIAARSLASRISAELGREPGTAVGYKVRFSDRVGPETYIKLMTDGMLLAEVQSDPWLNEYDTLIIDEAHERSLNIDFLLGYLKQLLPRRPELKLIVTSATIDPERLSQHFDGAPILEVSGRTYPVEVRYRPLEESAGERDETMQQAILGAVDELGREGLGDILVFLSGEREIRETAEHLRKHAMRHTEVLPLYARLSAAEQGRVFRSHTGRRIVLATNVAETSLTVPGIRYVVDPGFARISRYSHRSKVQRLPVEPVSQASADQRKGRCGRVADGICIRLYDEDGFDSRPEFTAPEILRTNLASVILRMKLLGFGDIESFPFVDPPDSRLVSDGYRLLAELGAVDARRGLTALGRELGRLPVDPRIGSMLLAASGHNCLREVLVVASALSIQDPRERPADKQQQADQRHAEFRHEDSDFLALLKLWEFLETQHHHLTRNKFQKLCRDCFLSWQRVQEWQDVHRQLRAQMHEMGYRDNDKDGSFEEIHSALLTGLLSNIGTRGEGKEYLGARSSRFWIFPGSGLFRAAPKWIVAAERVETTRLYARTVARIQPEWVERVAGHLLQRSYSEPRWEKNRAQVGALEKRSLYGLTLSARNRVNYGPINPREARELFIRFALVEGDFRTRAPFLRHNQELIEEIREIEHKARRHDVLIDEQALYDFYDRRVPAGIYSGPAFERWLRKASQESPKLLHMTRGDLMRHGASEVTAEDYPDILQFGTVKLPLEYKFEPGHRADGATLAIPLSVINQVSEEQCEWLVPGLLRERAIAMVRSLPKALRKSFVPIPETVDACLQNLEPSDRSFTRALADELKQRTGVYVPEDAWDMDRLPAHLRIHYRVLDDKGRQLAAGRDLAALRQSLADEGETSSSTLSGSDFERAGITEWDFGPLPDRIPVRHGKVLLQGYPSLVDEAGDLALRVLDSPEAARLAHRAGLRRLIGLRLGRALRDLQQQLGGKQDMRLQYAKAAHAPKGVLTEKQLSLLDELVALVINRTFLDGRDDVRDAERFEKRVRECRGRIMEQAHVILELAGDILDQYQKLRAALAVHSQPNWAPSLQDLRWQIDRLVYRGFLLHTPFDALQDYPRYLKGAQLRLEKLGHAAARDQQRMAEMEELFKKWRQRDEKARTDGKADPRLDEIRWLLEELRISLFAQELKTRVPVSVKRLEKRWQELGL